MNDIILAAATIVCATSAGLAGWRDGRRWWVLAVAGGLVPVVLYAILGPAEEVATFSLDELRRLMPLGVFATIVGVAGPVFAGLVAAHNGRRWWIWGPLGPVILVGPFVLGVVAGGGPLTVEAIYWKPGWIPGTICALWCGHIARTKKRSVFLWVVLGAIFLHLSLVVAALMWEKQESLLSSTLDAAIGPPPEPWFQRQMNRLRGTSEESRS
ncbi:MAG: hypothetical protein F4Z25_01265 [Chloroflexi bacterium]|nr:hypothetical protein [Chloroflexota bacterium]